MKRSRLFRIGLPAGIILLAVVVGFIMIKTRPVADKTRPPRSRPLVNTLTVQAGEAPMLINGFGTVEAKRRIEVVPQVSGRIIRKSPRFEAGEYVAAGDTLVMIEQTDYLQARAQARANLAQARTSLATAEQDAQVARREWERLRSSEDGAGLHGEPSPLVLREPQVAQARAAVEAAEAAVALAETNLARCTLTSPFTGRIESSTADAGQYVRSGTSLGALYAIDMAEITVPVPAEDMAWIRAGESGPDDTYPGDDVTVRADFAGRTFSWPGRAARLGGAVDRATRQVPVVVEVPDPFMAHDHLPALLPGMFVTAVFTGTPPSGAVVIPRAALHPGDKVWVITPEQTLSIRPVKVARAGVEEALIASGLSPGEMICISNLQVVTEGMPVRVAGAKTAVAAETDSTAAPRKGDGR